MNYPLIPSNMELVQDIWRSEIFPRLDNISFLCLQVAFCHTKFKPYKCQRLLDEVVKYSPDFVQYFINQQLLTDSSEILLSAARCGNLPLIEDLQSSYPDISWVLVAHEAISHGQLTIVKFIFDDNKPMPKDYSLAETAVVYDQLECLLLYIRDSWYDCHSLIERACVRGSFNCLKYLTSLTIKPNWLDLLSRLIDNSDSIECAKYLIETGELTAVDITSVLGMVSEGITVRILKYFVSIGIILTVDYVTSLLLYNKNINKGLYEFLHELGVIKANNKSYRLPTSDTIPRGCPVFV